MLKIPPPGNAEPGKHSRITTKRVQDKGIMIDEVSLRNNAIIMEGR